MAPVDYDKTELDASEQGSFLHQALQQFSVRPEWRTSVRTGSLPMIARTIEEAGTELCRLFAQNVEERLGKELPLLPQIQLERWEPMIRKTAKILLMKDRPVLEREWALNNGRGISFHGALIKGTLDRIEYDALSNTLYLIDFKTGASDSNPQKAHMVGGRFTNLQLPLYKMLLRQDRTFMERHPEIDLQTCRFICGYFWIYKKVDEIDYKIWENMEQYEPLAEETAKTVIDVVRRMSQNELQEDLQKHVKFDKYNELFLPEFSAVFQDGLALSEPPEYPRAPSGRGKKGGSK